MQVNHPSQENKLNVDAPIQCNCKCTCLCCCERPTPEPQQPQESRFARIKRAIAKLFSKG